MKQQKITLAEILVALAVIAILISLLLPALSRSRAKARQAACVSQQRQIGLALVLYQSDNNKRFPIYGSSSDEWVSWDDQLGDYDGREITQEDQKMHEEFQIKNKRIAEESKEESDKRKTLALEPEARNKREI